MEHTVKKQRVGIIFGGESAEHEVSLASAQNVITALDLAKFEPVPIGITKQGAWVHCTPEMLHKATPPPKRVDLQLLQNVDVVFPLVHGLHGEDGSLQGLFELLALPYVGSGVLSSAIAMDKEVAKRLLRDAGLTVADFIVLRAHETPDIPAIVSSLGLPLFIKPADSGSSVGVSKVKSKNDIPQALHNAFQYSNKVLAEKAVLGDEVECAVLGNAKLRASVPGRIIVKTDFYDYTAKYTEGHARLEIPARLSPELHRATQQVALKAYKALDCSGMARVDMFVAPAGAVIVNEVNTIPGFTQFSMYPKLWEASGLSYTKLITKLLHLAMGRF